MSLTTGHTADNIYGRVWSKTGHTTAGFRSVFHPSNFQILTIFSLDSIIIKTVSPLTLKVYCPDLTSPGGPPPLLSSPLITIIINCFLESIRRGGSLAASLLSLEKHKFSSRSDPAQLASLYRLNHSQWENWRRNAFLHEWIIIEYAYKEPCNLELWVTELSTNWKWILRHAGP